MGVCSGILNDLYCLAQWFSKWGARPPRGNTLQGGRDVTDGEKKNLPPTCHWLVKAPSVAKCKGLD